MKNIRSLLFLGLLPLLCVPAMAGHWNVHYECTGGVDEGNPDTPILQTYGWTYSPTAHYLWPLTDNHPFVSHQLIWDVVSPTAPRNFSRTSGHIKAVFTWTKDNPNDLSTVPETLCVKVTSNAMAGCGYFTYSPDGNDETEHRILGSVNNGYGSPPINVGGANTASKVLLLQVPVSSTGIAELEGVDVSASVSIPGNLDIGVYDSAAMGTSIFYQAQEDTRSVKLSRDGARDERQTLESNEWHTYGDSIYSAQGVDFAPDVKIPLDINANLTGHWSGGFVGVNATWDATGFGSSYAVSTYLARGWTQFGTPTIHWLAPFVTDYQGSPTGAETFDTTYTVVDNGDSATTKAYYHLTLHDPVEMLDEGETITNYQILKPYTSKGNVLGAGLVLGWPGLRDANSATIEINDETSTETGVELKATTEVKAFKGLLGLSAEANYKSTHKFTLTLKTEVPKDIADGQYRYLIAIHNFTRSHKRFYKYDAGGKIKRMVSVDAYGNAINPPVEMYHELIEDTAGAPDARWSDPIPYTGLDPNSLPTTPIPPVDYDFPSGGAS